MKTVTIGMFWIALLYTGIAAAQEAFVMKETGLSPQSMTVSTTATTPMEGYQQAVSWLQSNEKQYRLSVDEQTANESIHFSNIKGNAVNLGDSYYHARYSIRIRFDQGHYLFEPTAIQLKLNSKYDMGWKDVDLKDGSAFFKKGKVLRKYKSYLEDLTAPLNALQNELQNQLN